MGLDVVLVQKATQGTVLKDRWTSCGFELERD